MNKATLFFVMGVSGSGKTTIGKLLAKSLKIPFYDGDDYHPPANIKKMANGNPLNDDDRKEWLTSLNTLAINNRSQGAVIACSALKDSYRLLLGEKIEKQLVFVYLEGSFEEISRRLGQRKNHFMPADLLKSQFNTLEPPKDAITVSITQPPETIVSKIMEQSGLK